MTPEQLNQIADQIADLIAKSLEDWVPEAVDAAVEARLKELNLSENADIKEIKSQLKELVEKAKFWSSKDEDLTETKELFVNALKGLKNWDLSWKNMESGKIVMFKEWNLILNISLKE